MPLKNYTSSVPASRSISYIESKLVTSGARAIMKRYDEDGRTSAIMFIIPMDGQNVPFKLPARIDNCTSVLEGMLSSRARSDTRAKIPEQAERTAWKILSDWVEAQMAMIELAQVEVMEVFLPYVYDHATEKTYFEAVKDRGFKGLLPSGKESQRKE